MRIALIGAALCYSAGAQTKEYIRLNGRVIAIESPGACTSASSAISFRSSGNNGSGLLPDLSVDPNWKMVSNPGTYGGSSTTDAIVLSNIPDGFSPTFVFITTMST